MNAGVKAELHDRRKPLEERDYSRWTGIAGVTIPASRASSLLCPLRHAIFSTILALLERDQFDAAFSAFWANVWPNNTLMPRYNELRTYLTLEKDSPRHRPVQRLG
jgi:hypothetical protein